MCKPFGGMTFGKKIYTVVLCRNLDNLEMFVFKHISNEMILDLHMFCLGMKHQILSQLYGTLTITL